MARQLLIDIGNSRIKWAIKDGSEFSPAVPRVHRGQRLHDLLDMDFQHLTPPDRIFVSCVSSSAVRDALNTWIETHWQLQPHYLTSSAQECGVRNAYTKPQELGSDRWAAMLAAYHQQRGCVCVIDAGTALTIDVVRADGQHLGGMILPGLHGMQSALFSHTALQPITMDALALQRLLGTNTSECIRAGIAQALSALFERLLTNINETTGAQATCYLTGGDANEIAALLPRTPIHEPYLVLKGLAILTAAT